MASKPLISKQAIDQLKGSMNDRDWKIVVDSVNASAIGIHGLDEHEWYILNALNQGKQFELDKPYDIEQKGKGFKTGKIQLIRDTRDSKIFATSFHIERPDGANKLANITIYKYERKRVEETGEMLWGLDAKVRIDNPSSLDYPLSKLFGYIKKQLSLDGHILSSKYAKVVEGKSESELLLQSDILDKIKDLNDEEKLNEILTAVADNKNIIISRENYHKLIQSRYSNSNIKEYELDLEKLRALIDDPNTTETDMQNFIGDKSTDRSWFFGLDYIKTYQKFNPGLPCEYDFLLQRFNLVFDIVELKGPNAMIIEVSKESARTKPDPRIDYAYSAIFGRALHQVIDYMHDYEQHYRSLIKLENPSVMNFEGGQYPRGIIVMSKRTLIHNNDDLHKLNKQFSSVNTLTYDDLYDRGKNIVDFIKKTHLESVAEA